MDARSGTSTTRRLWRAGLPFVLALLTLVVPMLTPAMAPTARAATTDTVTISLTRVSSPVAEPGTPYTVTGRVRNGATTLSSLTVRLRVAWPRLDVAGIARWAGQGVDAWSGVDWASQTLAVPVAPGAEVPFSVTGDPSVLGLPVRDGFGPRGMTVEVIGDNGTGTARLAQLRSFLVWQPEQPAARTRLSVIAPFTAAAGTQSSDAGRPGGRVAAEWDDGGRLSRLVDATEDPDVTWLVDPSLLSAAALAQGLTDGTTSTKPAASGSATAGPSPTPTPSASTAADPAAALPARRWLEAMVTGARRRDVYALPWGDTDVEALAAGNGGPLLRAALDDAASVSRTLLERDVSTGLAWPVDGHPDAATQQLLSAARVTASLVNDTALPAGGVDQEGTDLVRLPDAPDLLGVVVDPTLGRAVGRLGTSGQAEALQRVVADLAARCAGLSATDSPGVVAPMPRGVDVTRPDDLLGALATLRSVPWIHVEQLSVVLAGTPAPAPTRLVGPASAPLPAAHVAAVGRAFGQLEAFRPAFARPEVSYRPLRRAALSLVSTTWRSPDLDETDRDRALARARAPLVRDAQRPYAALQVLTTAPVNLLTETAHLPVTVTSTLGEPLELVVVLRPQSGRLRASGSQPVALGAGTDDSPARATVSVPVVGVANGDVDVYVAFAAPGSTRPLVLVHEPIRVRVRHDWSSRGVTAAAGLLALLFLAGMARTVRGGRRARVPLESVPDPDDLALDAVEAPPARHAGGAVRLGAANGRVGAPAWVPAASSRAEVVSAVATLPGGISLSPYPPASEVFPRMRSWSPPNLQPDRPEPGRPEPGRPEPDRPEPGLLSPAPPAPQPSPPTRPGGVRAAEPNPDAGTQVQGDRALMRSSAVMTAGTMVSRVLGMIRTAVLALAIGSAVSADAFTTANTLPNNLFILIGGGVFNAVMVPQIVRAARRADGGVEFTDRLLTLGIVVLGGATVVLTASAPLLVRFYLGRASTPDAVSLATAFAVWCVPQIFFYGLYTLYGQVLNARGSFGPYMWAPVINNVVAIAGTVLFIAMAGSGDRSPRAWSSTDIAVLAGTATLGVVAQAFVLLPAMRRSGYRWRPRWGFRGVGLGNAGSVALWTFGAVALSQLGFVLVTRVLNDAGARLSAQHLAGGRWVFDSAYMIFMLPHSLVTVSLVTAMFTRMSAHAAAGRHLDVRDDLSLTLRTVGVATVFAVAAFAVVGREATAAIFLGTPTRDTDQYALVALALLVGVPFFSAQYLLQRAAYAYEDARTPFWIGVLGTAIWAVGSLVVGATTGARWVAVGVALVQSLSNLVVTAVWVVHTRRRLGGLDGARVVRTHARLVVAALVSATIGLLTKAAAHGLLDGHARARVVDVVVVLLVAVTMGASYLGVLVALRVGEVDAVIRPLRTRLTR